MSTESPTGGQPTGVHLVGSVPLLTAGDVFTQTTKALPGRLRRIPDGEPAHRQNFVLCQVSIFSATPQVLRQYDAHFNSIPTPLPTPADLESLSATLANLPPLQTRYDEYALESYATFKSLRSSGVLPTGTKFQVSLPSTLDTTCLIADGYQAFMEPIYREALFRALKNIQASIPHSDLTIQWDFASPFAMLEGATWPHFTPFFDPVREGVIERAILLANAVDPGVECGFHLCYGDIAHHHFIEPKDMGNLVEVAKAILTKSKRDINYIHMPVPKSRTDDEYYAPLKELELGKTELYLGVVHPDDLGGTKKRVETAAKTGKSFGVATECGMGRTPADQLSSILDISAAVSAPY